MTVHRLPEPEWRDRLIRNGNGVAKPNLANASRAVRGIPAIGRSIYYDEMRGCTVVEKPLPWSDDTGRDWTDHDDNKMTEFLQSLPLDEINVGTPIASQAVETVSYEQRRHPIREYLSSISWDGKPRIDSWLTYYLGADPSDLLSAQGRAWLISAVARVMSPGCKADHMLILEGAQGVGKSSALRALCARPEWFSDSLPPMIGGNKDAMSHLRGVWIIELAELAAMRGQVSTEAVKLFLTRQSDRYRPAYGRREADFPRQCVFAASTNLSEYLSDPTGNRRFWPVNCRGIDVQAIKRDRDQLWAEAMHAYKLGEAWHLVDDDIRAAAEREQSERRERDPWEEIVAEWVSLNSGDDYVQTRELLDRALGLKASEMDTHKLRRVGAIMRYLGYVSINKKVGGNVIKAWKIGSC